MLNKKTKSNILAIFGAFFLILLSILMLMPFVMMISTSFKNMAEINSPVFNFIPQDFHFESYTDILTSDRWHRYFLNSFAITIISTTAAVFINSMAGYAFAKLNFNGKGFMFSLVLFGLIVPAQVTMLPAYVVMKYIPFAGGNNMFGVGGSGLLNTTGGLILIYLAGSFGVFLFRQFMINLPASLDDAAQIDGLSKFGTYLRIYLPLCTPAIATMVVLRATATWNDYIWPLLMVQKDHQFTVQLALSQFSSESGREWNNIMAATTLIILPIIILFLFLQKYFVEGVATSGMKE